MILTEVASSGRLCRMNGSSPMFWVFALVGVAAVSYLAVRRASTKDLAIGDLYLLLAVLVRRLLNWVGPRWIYGR